MPAWLLSYEHLHLSATSGEPHRGTTMELFGPADWRQLAGPNRPNEQPIMITIMSSIIIINIIVTLLCDNSTGALEAGPRGQAARVG